MSEKKKGKRRKRPRQPATLRLERVWRPSDLVGPPRPSGIRILECDDTGRFSTVLLETEAAWLAYELARAYPVEAAVGIADSPSPEGAP